MIDAAAQYPALMAYITARSAIKPWYEALRADEAEAFQGGLADVANEMEMAQSDYAAAQKGKGQTGYPYNSAMGEYLGLAINPGNHEPGNGYYMAGRVMNHYRLGVATREADRLIAEGRTLRIVTARSKTDRKPVRFAAFAGPDQIKITGNEVTISNGKRRGRLSSNWSVETCLEKLVAALQSGRAFGEAA
jgi:hypothetical protein